MKPIMMLTQFIKNSSNQEEKVFDPFGGSGSTLIACEQTNRKERIVEIDPYYCSIIIERYEQYTGKKAKKRQNK
jgi:DNA modification methylase